MPRVKGSVATRARRKKVLKLAKGYFGSKHILYRTAHEQVMHSLRYAYRDRRQIKRDMRKLWITRINAGARLNDMSYSQLMFGLKLANIEVNRKMLSEIAIHDPKGFTTIVNSAKDAIKNGGKVEEVKEVKPAKEAKAKKEVKVEVAEEVVEVVEKKVAKKPAAKKTTTKKADDAVEAKPVKKTTKKKVEKTEE